MYNDEIILVYPEPLQKKEKRFGFSLNIAYISAILKASKLDTGIYDFSNDGFSKKKLKTYLDSHPNSIICIEFDSFALARSENYDNGIKLIQKIKNQYPKCYIISFGFDCVILKEKIAGSDITITEYPIIEVCKEVLRCKNINGMSIRNFDELPFPDREGFNSIEYFKKNSYSTLIQTSRGCKNSCIFCQRKGWQSERYEHSIDYIKKEFELLKKAGYKNIWVADENFTFNLQRAKKILKMLIETNYSAEMKIAISSWSKIDFEFLDLAKKANIKIISMGLETANKEVLSFYRKDINLMEVKQLIGYANKLGIYIVGNFIIGAPNESEEMISNTFEYINQTDLDQVNIKILDYMIGSDLYSDLPPEMKKRHHYFSCKENGLGKIPLERLKQIKSEFVDNFRIKRAERLKNKIKKYGTPYYPMIH